MKMGITAARWPIAAALIFAAGTVSAASTFYTQHNLVSDGAITADHTDPDLVNAWGIAFNPFGDVWVADNHTGKSTLYDGTGAKNSLVVTVPGINGEPGSPTGIVFNASKGFSVTKNNVSAPAAFIFVTEDGLIAGWSPTVDANSAVIAVPPSGGAIYKGVALSANGDGSRLYATDFHNNKVDVFDSNFQPVTTNGFVDPMLPKHFAPFGIQAIAGDIYVTYAKQDANAEDDVAGAGFGFVDVFDPNGNLIHRLICRGHLNAPWGLALAPAGFGEFGGRLLVGNFGDGKINAYDIASGRWVGQLQSAQGQSIVIDGLWGISFGNGFASQPVDTLFFAAGPNDEANGLYGRIDVQSGN
jgi:uncharacterized protein (TIGR03118 family)